MGGACGAGPKVTEREIPSEIKLLNNAVSELQEQANSLAGRIEPIMDSQKPANALETNDENECCEIAGMIRSERKRIQAAIRWLSEWRERIQL